MRSMNTQDLRLFHLFNKFRLKIIILFGVLLFLFVGFATALGIILFYLLPPVDFPVNQIISIEKGETLKEVAGRFERENLIKSAFWFETVGWIMGAEKEVKAGEYFFENKLPAVRLMERITGDHYKNEFVKITIPEGYSIRDIGFVFENKGMWQAEELWEVTGLPATEDSLEGFLFPDTYYVPVDISPKSFVELMEETFNEKVTMGLKEEIEKSGHSLREIITMASLLEKEAATEEDRKIISGILWKRLEDGMPLQVDAIFPYIIGKYSLGLTTEDLKTDSPYNTYFYKGLPVGPIANPGLDAIKAALEPTESPSWYYLSDKEGNIYYSATYDQHLTNKEKYLK